MIKDGEHKLISKAYDNDTESLYAKLIFYKHIIITATYNVVCCLLGYLEWLPQRGHHLITSSNQLVDRDEQLIIPTVK